MPLRPDMPAYQRVLLIEEALVAALAQDGIEIERDGATAEHFMFIPDGPDQSTRTGHSLYALAARLERVL